MLLAGVVEKPVPVMVRVKVVGALSARPAVLLVTVGAATMVATCTAAPLVPPPLAGLQCRRLADMRRGFSAGT